MTSNKVLNAIENEFVAYLDSDNYDSKDQMEFTSALGIMGNSARSESIHYTYLNKLFSGKNSDIVNRINKYKEVVNEINSKPLYLPPLFADTPATNRFIQLDDDNFMLLTASTNGSLSMYLSSDKCLSWKRCAGYFGLPSTDTRYKIHGSIGIGVCLDTAVIDGISRTVPRIFWVDSNSKLKTSTINPDNGIYLNEEVIIDTALAKSENIYAKKNSVGDIILTYTEVVGTIHKSYTIVKGAGKSTWVNIPLIDHNGVNHDAAYGLPIVVDDVFYFFVSNNVDRLYLVKVWKNNADEFEREIIIRKTGAYTNCKMFRVYDDSKNINKLVIISSTQNVLEVDINSTELFFKQLSYVIESDLSKVDFVFKNGTYIKSDSNSVMDNEDDILYSIPFTYDKLGVAKLESYDYIPVWSNGNGYTEIRLISVDSAMNPNSSVRGI